MLYFKQWCGSGLMARTRASHARNPGSNPGCRVLKMTLIFRPFSFN